MTGALLFVGSIPLETAEEVMRTFGRSLGTWLDYLPDGEVGDRRYWIDGIAYRVLNGHNRKQARRGGSIGGRGRRGRARGQTCHRAAATNQCTCRGGAPAAPHAGSRGT